MTGLAEFVGSLILGKPTAVMLPGVAIKLPSLFEESTL